MVMDRRHAENALAGELEAGDLDHHRQRFHHEHAAHDEQHHFLADDHGNGAQRCAQGQRADVAHEDLRRIGVEPEEAEAGTDQRAAEDDEFSGTGDVGDQQILGEIHVTGEVTEDAQTAADHHGRHDRQAVEAVGEVDRIARTNDDEIGENHETDAQRDLDVLQQRQDQRRFNRRLRSHIKEDRRTEAEHRLPEILPAAWQPARVLLDHLAVVIDPPDGAEQQCHRQHYPHVAVGQVGPE